MADRGIEDSFPLSPMQQGALYHTLSAPNSGVGIVQLLIDLDEDLDAAAFREAWRRVLGRHAALRVAFRMAGLDQPVQDVHAEPALSFAHEDLRGLSAGEQERRIGASLLADRRRGFSMHAAPLMRWMLFRLADARWRCVWTYHHMLADGRSLPIILGEVFALYDAGRGGPVPDLPEPRPYRDHIDWLGRQDKARAEQYWRRLLAGYDTPVSVRVAPRPGARLREQNRPAILESRLSEVPTAALDGLARETGVALSTIVQGAWAVLLSRYGMQDDVVFGAIRPCRDSTVDGVENTVGMFFNTLPVRIVADPGRRLGAWLQEIRAQEEAAGRYEYSPLADVQKWSDGPPGQPLFGTLIEFEDFMLGSRMRARGGPWQNRSIRFVEQSYYPLTMVVDAGRQLYVRTVYDPTVFDEDGARSVTGHFANLLESMAGDPERPLSALRMLADDERQRLLVDWNDAAVEHPPARGVHELFERQAARTPEATAVEFGKERLTYAQLNARADEVARALSGRAGEGQAPVAIMLDRSVEMVAGLLGILKAGRAYMPIDPAFPAERVREILDDSGARILLTDSATAARHPLMALRGIHGRRSDLALSPHRPPIEDLDSLPIPDRSLIDYSRYQSRIGLAPARHAVTLQTTRGCPYGCLYCHRIWPKRCISRSAVSVLEEIRQCYEAGARRFAFADDAFNLRRGGGADLLHGLIESGMDVQLFFQNGLRGDVLTHDHIDLLVEAGLAGLSVALEAASPRLQKVLRKNLDIDRLRDNIEYIAGRYPHVILELNTMIGFPTETEEEALMTLEFVESIRWLHFPNFNVLRIYPNTEMYAFAVDNGVSEEAIERSTGRAYHELPETLPFPLSFARECQSRLMGEYILSKERLLTLLPHQLRTLAEDELVEKYDTYLPAKIESLDDVLHLAGVGPGEADAVRVPSEAPVSVPDFSRDRSPDAEAEDPGALRILLLDLSLQFSADVGEGIYDVVEAPLGLMCLMTYLKEQHGSRVAGRIAKSRVDFDSFAELEALVRESRPQVVGLRTLSVFKEFFHETVWHLRRWLPGVPFVTGGPYATSEYATILQDPHIDLVVLGEGELTFAELIGHVIENGGRLPDDDVLARIPGLTFVPEGAKGQGASREVVLLDDLPLESAPAADEQETGDLAYVLYTSGSTGRPKGVMVPHSALNNHMMWMQREFPLAETDAVLQKTPFTFDASVWEFWAPLIAGARLVVARPGGHQDIRYMGEAIRSAGVTVVQFVPSLLALLLQEGALSGCSSLKRVFCGGEALTTGLRDALFAQCEAELVNLYGPTEACIDATYCRVAPAGHTVPIGRPVDNTRAYIVDGHLRPMPVGVAGELCLGGAGLARGYLGREDLTAERFVRDPFSESGREILYRTGDLARYRPDGNIEFVGRIDHQVKVRGHRIELGEIEAVLARHPRVRASVVAVGEGRGRLVAYCVTDADAGADAAELRSYLGEFLPAYMVPEAFVFLDSLPRTGSGKIDRAALPEPEDEAAADATRPRNPVEEAVAGIWADALGVDSVGIRANFFDVGGHSLTAMLVMSRTAETLGVDLPIPALLEAPTVEALAARIAERRSGGEGGERAAAPLPALVPDPDARFEPFPLTDVQEAYWVGRGGEFALGRVGTHAYAEFDVSGLDLPRLESALQALVGRHDMLRAVILPDGRQQVLERVPAYHIEVLDLSLLRPDAAELELQAVRQRMAQRVQPSDRWPLFEVRASRLEGGRIRLHVGFDGLIGDALSADILLRELYHLYEQPDTPLPPPEVTFRDYVTAMAGIKDSDLWRRSRDYWVKRLPDLPNGPQLPLATDPASVLMPVFSRRIGRIGPERWQRIKKKAARIGASPAGVLIAAFSEVLRIWSVDPRFTLNLTLFNRLPLHPQINEVVGDFTSLSLLEVGPDGGRFEERVRRVQRQLWQDLDHRHFGAVEVLREAAAHAGDGSGPTTMPVVLTYAVRESREGEDEALDWLGEGAWFTAQTPQVWLDQMAAEISGGLAFGWFSVEELFPEGLLKDMFAAYSLLLESLADAEDTWEWTGPRLARELLPPAQHDQRRSVNDTAAPVPEGSLHDGFFRQAAEHPDRPAVISGDSTLTYGELARCSNGIARELRNLGLRPGSLVAVVMEKGWEQVAAALGVLAGGGAYLPIEASVPTERLHHLLRHGEVSVVLTQPHVDTALAWPDGVRRVIVADGLCADSAPAATQGPEDLAYVIYTSGSTGLPKGVMIEHRSALNTVVDVNERFEVDAADRVLALSSLSFDLSVYDIFGLLAAGGAVVMPEEAARRDPSQWARLVLDHGVTVWNTVPALMALLVEYVEKRPELQPLPLRTVLLSGDWIPVGLPDRVRRVAPGAEVVSLGGATEASIWSILYPIEAVDQSWRSIPYGKPMLNQTFHVFDECLEERPVWVTGELYIGGVGLARGYWRDPERTDASFVTHPRTGARLYRTGDMGRYLPDGNIEFLGRRDFQVKVQGYRVELGEIEAALDAHPEVRTATVTATGDPRGARRLVAYVVPRGGTAPDTAPLRRFLEKKLPGYMVPSAFVVLDEMPLTPTGKVDRRALPDAEAAAEPARSEPKPPAGSLQARIAEMVATIVSAEPVEPDRSLLDMGATSIEMIRIANLMETELGVRPDMNEFYRRPTVTALAQLCAGPRAGGEQVAVVESGQVSAIIDGFDLILDPEDRERFKDTEPGLRRVAASAPGVDLPAEPGGAPGEGASGRRRSCRHFLARPLEIAGLGGLLACLRRMSVGGRPKYLYASAGGLYPVQTYLWAREGRIRDLEAGTFYYHPGEHRLVSLVPGAQLPRETYDPLVNGPIFDEAAFAIFLVAQMSAMAPMYGADSMRYALIESGAMAHQLECAGPACGIGLCQIGGVDFGRVRGLFVLDASHVLVNSLLGGAPDPDRADAPTAGPEPYRAGGSHPEEWEEGEV